MEGLIVNLKELKKHCKEWDGECEKVRIVIDKKREEITIEGITEDGCGIIASDLDPIKGTDELPLFFTNI